ncbi:AI-2E family transporter [Belliella sp. DSM 111904]|uniref:AI-2E family transporter n=1 Tax=Belliella filtrata TaxID=2923435 RepID=A0ABS9V447_9BACT|nr:AI-2E family transporter [Belliella filtrata]MCH7411183.1 AI-2E family transporter [Belliella filtrata]
MEQTPIKLPSYIKALLVLCLTAAIIFTLIVGKSILIPLFLGGFISILLTPFGNWLESKKFSRVFSAIISLISAILVTAGFITFVILQVASFTRDLDNVGDRLNNYLSDIDSWVYDNFAVETGIGDGIDKGHWIELLQSNSSSLAEFVLNTIGSMSGIILLPVFIFFFLIYRDHLTEFIVNMFKEHDQDEIKSKIRELRKLVQRYIVGIVKVMAILAVLNSAVLFGLGIKHAIFFAVFAAILNIIPYLGPFLGAILPMVFAFLTKDSLFYPLGVVAAFMIIQLIESNFLTPKIVGSNVNLNAFITFIGLLVGASIWGVIGMIMIIPTLAVLRKIFELDESTRPFALLLGEEKEKIENEKSKS